MLHMFRFLFTVLLTGLSGYVAFSQSTSFHIFGECLAAPSIWGTNQGWVIVLDHDP